ncbi:SH3 domain-containing protein [Rhizoctonia solani]|nr:SH3 domain-containing protein [Rhizoctonia solani]
MAPIDPLLSHLLSRLEADVRFLADQGHISRADSQTVLDVFSRAGANVSISNITSTMGGMGIGSRTVPTGMPTPYGAPSPVSQSTPAPPAFSAPSSAPYSGPENTAPPAFPGGPPIAPAYTSTPSPAPGSALKRPVPPPPPAGAQCKALWDYNLDGLLKDDLSFRAGDVIQIVKEDNADWWSGRLNGREGMFPVNHVEKLPSTPSYGYDEKQQYSQPHQYYAPPLGPPATYQQGGPAQAAPEEEKKKSGLGKYKSQMASAGASGLGFGAGAAIGGGIIGAIF